MQGKLSIPFVGFKLRPLKACDIFQHVYLSIPFVGFKRLEKANSIAMEWLSIPFVGFPAFLARSDDSSKEMWLSIPFVGFYTGFQ